MQIITSKTLSSPDQCFACVIQVHCSCNNVTLTNIKADIGMSVINYPCSESLCYTVMTWMENKLTLFFKVTENLASKYFL